ncbi:hypothetical protein NC653_040827 [Populus alba x Populus x berolinensis]|uniref:Uncharacterized protein n=1 Tax=Populus alba x Populus x berolinensis TaxID=444605 RepID=A0AAD6PQ27_9ROSI|nr:hypothetical protein NC653_040827 [Populus alba x Populus x berolinensis]
MILVVLATTQVDITISEINPSLRPCLSSTEHSKDTTLNSESEDEDTQTVNDDKAIPYDHPHPGKLMFMTLRLLLISALTDWKRLLSSIPMLQQTCLYIHYPCFLKLWNLKSKQNVLDCTTLLLAILASEETELQEKALVLQPNSCMGRSKTTSHDDLGVMDFEDTTQKSSSIAV